jgi:hypothetical protein
MKVADSGLRQDDDMRADGLLNVILAQAGIRR